MFMQDITRFASAPVTAVAADLSTGILAGTLVETAAGWRPVEELRVGAEVYTLDGGLCRIAALSRREVLPGEPVILVQGGSFSACADTLLMPGQSLLIDTVGLMAAPYVRLRAETLVACVGASRSLAPRRTEIVTPIFAEEEVIWAQSGLLLHCPGVKAEATAFPELHDKAAGLFLTERMRWVA